VKRYEREFNRDLKFAGPEFSSIALYFSNLRRHSKITFNKERDIKTSCQTFFYTDAFVLSLVIKCNISR